MLVRCMYFPQRHLTFICFQGTLLESSHETNSTLSPFLFPAWSALTGQVHILSSKPMGSTSSSEPLLSKTQAQAWSPFPAALSLSSSPSSLRACFPETFPDCPCFGDYLSLTSCTQAAPLSWHPITSAKNSHISLHQYIFLCNLCTAYRFACTHTQK